jgi:1-acyl-sn-glycerol-3-phosphate acyltransferase
LLIFRSLTFNIAWYVNIIIRMVVQTPFYFFLPRKMAWFVPKNWARANNWLHKHIAGTHMEVTGRENIPDGGFIIASKHQSTWEVYALLELFDDPAYVLKRELMWIPFFGWYVAKMGMIPINRGDRSKALREMMVRAREEIARGRQILIYPEGTRRVPGAEPDYKYGIVRLYGELGCPVLPIALNSGLYWPRRKFLRYPGTIRVSILPPIEPGLKPAEFHKTVQNVIEAECDRLYEKAVNDPDPPPLPEPLARRFAGGKTLSRK